MGRAALGRSVSACFADKAVPWGVFLRSRPVWAIIVAHFAYNWYAPTRLTSPMRHTLWQLGSLTGVMLLTPHALQ